jgi:hypothetical protein
MFRFSPKRSLLVRLLASLGPPPPPPRRHFSKLSDSRAQYPPGAGHHHAGHHHAGQRRARRAA